MTKSGSGFEWAATIGRVVLVILPTLTQGCSAFSLDPIKDRLGASGNPANTESQPWINADGGSQVSSRPPAAVGTETGVVNQPGVDASAPSAGQSTADDNLGQTSADATHHQPGEGGSRPNSTATDDTATGDTPASDATTGEPHTSDDTSDDSSDDTSDDTTGACTAAVHCDNPPSPRCADDDTLTRFAANGSCRKGECEYADTDEPCAFGCSGGACLPDPCDGVECEGPPANTCESDSLLRAFDAQGTCVNGACDYTSHVITCSCASGACQTDPCLDVTCNSPPEATCNDTSYRTFAQTGTCSQGSCDYQRTDTQCYACGAGGCYCPAGTAVAGDGCLECNDGTYSDSVNAPNCELHAVCVAGYYGSRSGSRTNNQECTACPDNTFSDGTQANACAPHRVCSAPYVEATPPSKTADRTCKCPQTCGDGSCIAANQCCEPTPIGQVFVVDTLETLKEYTFCLEMPAKVRLVGGVGGGGPNVQIPTIWAILYDAAGNTLASFTNGSEPALVDVQPGTYSVTLSVSYGVDSGGGVEALIEAP